MKVTKRNRPLLGGFALLVVGVSAFEQPVLAKWKSLGSGLGTTGNDVYALTVYEGKLIAGGNFVVAGGLTANRIASWDGDSWQPLGSGMNSAVYALTVYNGDLIAGGAFTTADGQPANHIARWDGTSWHSLGNGMAGGGGGGGGTRVESLVVYNGELIAGGDFTTAGTQIANHIARWDGTSWSALGDEIGIGNGNDTCLALAAYNDEVIAGGDFTIAGETTYIIRWDGASWQPLGATSEINAQVLALTVHNGELIAGGNFAISGGEGFNGIARWNGSLWQAMGGGFSGVAAVMPFQGRLIAGFGHSFEADSGAIFNRIARWNGTSWQTMDTGMNLPILALTVFGDQVIAGGSFTFASNEPVNRIARWAPCIGDVTEDEVVNVTDLLIIITFWANPSALDGIADVNDDNLVNVTDLLTVINGWGPCP